jgi:uncharacterized protein (TIGR00304 family)
MFIKRLIQSFSWAPLKMVNLSVLYMLGIVLVVVGIIVIVAAIIRATMGGEKSDRLRGAGVIMIGPIPIIFGTDKKSVKEVLALVLALTVVVLIILMVTYWLR